MVVIEIVIDIEPVAQGRPRFAIVGKRMVVYNPKRSKQYQLFVGAISRQIRPRMAVLTCPLALRLTFCKQIPASWSKQKKEDARTGKLLPTSKPDLDNYVKAVQDALNGIVYLDDSQVVRLVAEKRYADTPKVIIQIEEVQTDEMQL